MAYYAVTDCAQPTSLQSRTPQLHCAAVKQRSSSSALQLVIQIGTHVQPYAREAAHHCSYCFCAKNKPQPAALQGLHASLADPSCAGSSCLLDSSAESAELVNRDPLQDQLQLSHHRTRKRPPSSNTHRDETCMPEHSVATPLFDTVQGLTALLVARLQAMGCVFTA